MPLTGDDEAAYNLLAMTLQRDINCLADPERSVRRRACDKLLRVLQGEAHAISVVVLRELCTSNMLAPLLQCAQQDTVEKCREKALTMLLFFAERQALHHSDAVLRELVALLSARMGKLPFAEPTEEIRLLLLQLFYVYIKQLSECTERLMLRDVIADIANVLGKTALDPFPEVKKLTADSAIVLARGWKHGVALQVGMIVRPMVTNLGHQHSRVRTSALQALEAVVPCASESLPELMKDVLLPAVSKIVFDRAASVRKQLLLTVATWLREIEDVRHYEAALLPLLLAGAVDESAEVVEVFHINFGDLASKWQAGDASREDGETMDEPMKSEQEIQTPVYFKTRPPESARRLARRIAKDVLPELLEKTGDWTVHVRDRYTRILSVYLVLLEDAIDPFLDKVFAALAKNCRDDEEVVVESVKECSRVVGHYADTATILSSLLPMVAGRVMGQDTAQHRTNGLILLGMSIEGMALSTIEVHLDAIVQALCDPGVRESEVADLQDHLAIVVASVIQSARPLLATRDEIVFQLFWILNHLLAASADGSLAAEEAVTTLGNQATACNQTVEELYERYLGRLLTTMQLPTDTTTVWKKSHPHRVLFDSLCRRGGVACAKNMSTLVPVIILHLAPTQEADVRLAFLALLETMLGSDANSQSFKPFNTELLLKAIVPNIVWQGGRVAATIRKVAIACAYTLLRQDIADQPCLFETAPQMLPVLKSCLDDSDAKTRQLVCLALQYLFVALPGCLGEEPVHQLYSEILKRLDDSNDIVRRAACQTFKTFLGAAPKQHFQGTIINYTLDCLFVHLDDADPEIQNAVLDVLKETVNINAPLLAKKAQENRSRHQSPKYCDQILALAESHAS